MFLDLLPHLYPLVFLHLIPSTPTPPIAQRDSPEYASYSMNVLKSPSDGGASAGDFDTKSMISESQPPPSQSRAAPTQGAWINTMSSGGASVSGMSRRSVPSARGKGVRDPERCASRICRNCRGKVLVKSR